jgi:hypothetical protein
LLNLSDLLHFLKNQTKITSVVSYVSCRKKRKHPPLRAGLYTHLRP